MLMCPLISVCHIPYILMTHMACRTYGCWWQLTIPCVTLQVSCAEEYLAVMNQEGITIDMEQRRQAIWAAATASAADVGGIIPDTSRGDLLDEIANLVESPTVVRGTFDSAFLALPK